MRGVLFFMVCEAQSDYGRASVPVSYWSALLPSVLRFLPLRQVGGYSQLSAYQCSQHLNSLTEFSTPYVRQLK